MTRKAFSLIEVLVVCVIVCIILSLLLAGWQGARKVVENQAEVKDTSIKIIVQENGLLKGDYISLGHIEFDGHHWLIMRSTNSGSIQHHPDCPCQKKAEKE